MKNYAIIEGGELRNKGAQAMSFIAIQEIRRRFPELEPVLVSSIDAAPTFLNRLKGDQGRSDLKQLNFEIIWGGNETAVSYILGCKSSSLTMALRKANRRRALERLKYIYDNAALFIDISGFSFGEKWGIQKCMMYLERIQCALSRDIPVYLLPQSFGPFNFSPEPIANKFMETANEVLPKVRIAFAREKQGFVDLSRLCPACNVVSSNDMVLQSEKIDYSSLFKDGFNSKFGCLGERRYVGIVPNARSFQFGGESELLEVYAKIIHKLRDMGYSALIIRHAAEDLIWCQKIKALFPNDEDVEVLSQDLYCFQYGAVFSRCSFLIASRFHSIVHGYQAGIPSVALGWAVKYQELLGLFGQENLVFDVGSDSFCMDDVIAAIDDVALNLNALKSRIESTLACVRQDNVFDIVEADFKSIG